MPFPSPGDLPDPGIKPRFPAFQADALTSEPPGKHHSLVKRDLVNGSQGASLWASLITQLVKNPPAMQEIWVRSLGQEDPLEKEMATHSSILAWKIPWTEEPGRL